MVAGAPGAAPEAAAPGGDVRDGDGAGGEAIRGCSPSARAPRAAPRRRAHPGGEDPPTAADVAWAHPGGEDPPTAADVAWALCPSCGKDMARENCDNKRRHVGSRACMREAPRAVLMRLWRL